MSRAQATPQSSQMMTMARMLEEKDDEIERIERELNDATNKVDRLEWENKGIAEWRDIALEREQQLAASQKQIVMLRDALKLAADTYNSVWERHMPIIEPEIDKALAATADLEGLVLCDVKHVAWIDEDGFLFNSVKEPEEYTPLYARRTK